MGLTVKPALGMDNEGVSGQIVLIQMTIEVEPADMLLFAEVLRSGSFTGAAARLGLTKQTVSARIARLEGALGVRLIERTTRRLRATEEGALYQERCAAIARQIREANEEVSSRQAEPTGLLRVSAPYLYGRRFLSPVIARYARLYPGAQLEVALGDRRVDLLEEGFDLAIRINPEEDSSLSARRVGESRVSYVASPALLRRAGSRRPERVLQLPCVGTRASETWELGGQRHRIAPRVVVNDLELACDAVVAGAGVARLPGLVCGGLLAEGRLQEVWPEEGRPVAVYAVFPSRKHLSAKVRAFIDLLSTEVEGPLPGARPRGQR
jgi:DNA-binding transcriptional LysR family regulator